ncbi:hypothetical protein L6307_04800 [Candidatus Parcubacteria bacterium]|nr:hypothetical protein [Candidatus Parcubacteria bacterium]
MHVYIYDSFLNQKKYEKVTARIETRITDLGLNGKINRLGPMKNINDLISNELKRGAKTITAVGNDATVCRAINSMAGSEVPLGIIPISKEKNSIAASLGIGLEEEACDVLSARRIIKLDLGKANNFYFLANASIANRGTTIEINKHYSIEILEDGEVGIVNLGADNKSLPENINSNPQDGILELFIKTKQSKTFLKKLTGQSIFPFKKLTIVNRHHPVVLDGTIKINSPIEISVEKQALNVIVGKERGF